MAELLPVVEGEKIAYEGVFNAKELLNIVKTWCSDKGYVYTERSHTETTKPEGRYAELNLLIFKKFTDYAKSMFKIRISYNDLKDIVVERDGKKTKLQEGKVSIVLSGILETDYEGRWESKPLFYVLRIIWEKYVYSPFLSEYERTIKSDVLSLKNNLKSYLNLTEYLQPTA